jgi:5-methylcytosine-specific restriction enzyme subunit McrC
LRDESRPKESRLKGPLFERVGEKRLRAQQYVGVIQLGANAIEVRPKIDGLNEQGARSNLLRMLGKTRRLQIFETDLARMSRQQITVLEVFIRLFCEKLFTEVHRGLVGRYERHEDNLTALRGKLQIGLQTTLNAFRPDRFRCRFDEFTVDTPVNRVLKAAVSRLRRITRDRQNATRLSELQFILGDVTDLNPTALEWHRIHYDRANRRYQPLAELAAMILENATQDVTAGSGEGYGILFDMNELFEEYIGEVLRATHRGPGVSVKLQSPCQFLLRERANGQPVFQTRPDVTGMRDGKPAWILDTKWKELDLDERTAGVRQEDVYQMLGYVNRYGVDDIILLYPHHNGLPPEPGIQKTFTILGACAGTSERRMHVCTVDLGDLSTVPEQLREIVAVAERS